MQNKMAKHSTGRRYGSVCPSASNSHSLSIPSGVSLWKRWREVRVSSQGGCKLMDRLSLQRTSNSLCLQLRRPQSFPTQGQVFFHCHCLQNHALHQLHLNQVYHLHPCCSSSLKICQNLTGPLLNRLPNLSSY